MQQVGGEQIVTLQRPAERFQPPAPKAEPPTIITDNVLGARTDLELRTILNNNLDKTVVVDFGSAFCHHCKALLPHFISASREHPKQKFVVASMDYMHVETQGIVYSPTISVYKKGKKVDSYWGIDAQRLKDHLWLHEDD
jgi:thioredoxin 1